MFLKIGMLFNGAVGVLLGIPIVRYLLSPVTAGGSRATKAGSPSAPSISFPRARRAWRRIAIRSPTRRMEKRRTSPAGCVTSMAIASRYSRSIARTWAAPCDGFRNRDSSCALAMAELTTRTARARPVRRSGACSNTRSRFSTEICTSRRARCPRPVFPPRIKLSSI